jgi:hypothetical protein
VIRRFEPRHNLALERCPNESMGLRCGWQLWHLVKPHNTNDDDRKLNQSFFEHLKCHNSPIKIQKSPLTNHQSKG